jgi:hypothetical protein
MFFTRKIRKYTWICPEGNTHNQTDYFLIDRRRLSSILDVRSFRGADRSLVVAEVRERLAVSASCREHRYGEIQCKEVERGGC